MSIQIIQTNNTVYPVLPEATVVSQPKKEAKKSNKKKIVIGSIITLAIILTIIIIVVAVVFAVLRNLKIISYKFIILIY